MRLKIISDGTATGTHVVNADTGDELKWVRRVTFDADARGGFVHATIELYSVEVDAVINADVKPEPQAKKPMTPEEAWEYLIRRDNKDSLACNSRLDSFYRWDDEKDGLYCYRTQTGQTVNGWNKKPDFINDHKYSAFFRYPS